MRNQWRVILIALMVGTFTFINGPALSQDVAGRPLADSGIKSQEIFRNSILGLAEKLASFSGDPKDLLSFLGQIQKVRSELTFQVDGASVQNLDKQAIDLKGIDSSDIGEFIGFGARTERRAQSVNGKDDVDTLENLLRFIITPSVKRPEVFLGFKDVQDFDDYSNRSILSLLKGITGNIDAEAVREQALDGSINQNPAQDFLKERIEAGSDKKE